MVRAETSAAHSTPAQMTVTPMISPPMQRVAMIPMVRLKRSEYQVHVGVGVAADLPFQLERAKATGYGNAVVSADSAVMLADVAPRL